MNSFADVQIKVDVGGSDYVPHTFISITHPDGRQIEYGLGPAKDMSVSGPGKIDITGTGSDIGRPHEYNFSGDTIPLTEQQYRDLMRDINDAIANPPDYILPGSWWPTDGTNCTGWVIDLWSKHDFPDQFGVTNTWVWNPYGQGISLYARDLWNQAKNWVFPRDPIILDLDGHGLQTVGLSSRVYFDHNGDGILSKTGWVGEGDALLVWDRNANGLIDNGAELFGDFTQMPDGTLAPNGFAALAALDTNGDGILDVSDPAFTELKLWVDSDQNAVTGEGELISLADAGIASLNLGSTLKNQKQSNGNTLAREGSFTRTDGTESAMGEFHLAIDTFDTQFAEQIEVPESLRGLPMMNGSGNVRDLQQAATQSSSLQSLLGQFEDSTDRFEQQRNWSLCA